MDYSFVSSRLHHKSLRKCKVLLPFYDRTRGGGCGGGARLDVSVVVDRLIFPRSSRDERQNQAPPPEIPV